MSFPFSCRAIHALLCRWYTIRLACGRVGLTCAIPPLLQCRMTHAGATEGLHKLGHSKHALTIESRSQWRHCCQLLQLSTKYEVIVFVLFCKAAYIRWCSSTDLFNHWLHQFKLIVTDFTFTEQNCNVQKPYNFTNVPYTIAYAARSINQSINFIRNNEMWTQFWCDKRQAQ